MSTDPNPRVDDDIVVQVEDDNPESLAGDETDFNPDDDDSAGEPAGDS